MVILLLLDITKGFIVWPREGLWTEVASLKLEIDVERNEAAAAELIFREQFRELQEVVIHDLVPDLLIIFHIDAAILEDAILHLHMIQQAILWVKPVE